MSYQVLARKWRPKTLEEVVGQEHIVRALRNALTQQRLHHAYLFTGTRGVGKTTIARILAKCFNCETGITALPCGRCNVCKEINEGRFVDLIEVDAASRTKVEDTRELLDNVQYAPARGRTKIYLIDEVHMLSTHSFNALLKTLEEPPAHVKFLLATTDPQKVPVTILSRCLQFTLKPLSAELIAGHLEKVLAAEAVEQSKSALMAIGRAAQGSLRDALSLTDQAIAYGGGALALETVHEMLGTINTGALTKLLEQIASRDVEAVLSCLDTLVQTGVDLHQLVQDLLSALHHLSLSKAIGHVPQSFTDDESGWQALAERFSAAQLQVYYQMAVLGLRDLAWVPQLREGVEMLLLRMMLFDLSALQSDANGSPESNAQSESTQQRSGSSASPASTQPHHQSDHSVAGSVVKPVAVATKPVATTPITTTPITTTPITTTPVTTTPVTTTTAEKVEVVANVDADTKPQAKPQAATQTLTTGSVADVTLSQAVDSQTQEQHSPALAFGGDLQLERWMSIIASAKLKGPALNIAQNCVLRDGSADKLHLVIAPMFKVILTDNAVKILETTLKQSLSGLEKVSIVVEQHNRQTPLDWKAKRQAMALDKARMALETDTFVQCLQNQFDAVARKGSIKSLSEQV